MGLAVLPVLVPDIRKTYDAYFAAFKDDVILEIMFPTGVNSEFRDIHTAHTFDWWQKSECQYTVKCVDSETGEVVGMGLWDVYLEERKDDEWKNPGVPWLEGEARERAESVINPLWEKKAQLWGGRRYVYCHVIAVKPEHQRRGAGAMLTQWGLDAGESVGLPVYLESSRAAYGLYQKLGFEKVGSVTHKAELVKESSDVEVPLMVKMPSAAKGVSFEQWRANGYPEGYR